MVTNVRQGRLDVEKFSTERHQNKFGQRNLITVAEDFNQRQQTESVSDVDQINRCALRVAVSVQSASVDVHATRRERAEQTASTLGRSADNTALTILTIHYILGSVTIETIAEANWSCHGLMDT